MHPDIREVQKEQLSRVPEIRSGFTVRIHQKIKEGGKERVQIFEGLVIKVSHGEGVEKTMTVRKVVEGIGVEKVYPIHSANIVKIEVKKRANVRRSKLYYMRKRSGKSARLQERHVSDQERADEEARMDALIEEAVVAEEKRKAAEEAESGKEAVAETTEEESAEATAEEGKAEEVVAEAGEPAPAETEAELSEEAEKTEA
jgi:large subunit ribosomal protein L19